MIRAAILTTLAFRGFKVGLADCGSTGGSRFFKLDESNTLQPLSRAMADVRDDENTAVFPVPPLQVGEEVVLTSANGQKITFMYGPLVTLEVGSDSAPDQGARRLMMTRGSAPAPGGYTPAAADPPSSEPAEADPPGVAPGTEGPDGVPPVGGVPPEDVPEGPAPVEDDDLGGCGNTRFLWVKYEQSLCTGDAVIREVVTHGPEESGLPGNGPCPRPRATAPRSIAQSE